MMTALGPGGLPRFDEGVLSGDDSTTTPRRENVGDPHCQIPSQWDNVLAVPTTRREGAALGALTFSPCSGDAGYQVRYHSGASTPVAVFPGFEAYASYRE